MNRTAQNQKARQKIAAIARKQNLTLCEARLAGCMGLAHAPAHRHKRRWYYDKDESLLWKQSQWIACCQACHHKIEFDATLTERLFKELRGEDDV